MNSKYKVLKYNSDKFENIEDLISIEEPLEISIKFKDIDTIESFGDEVGQYNIQNKILATLNNSENINISKIKRDFITNSSFGVCGKSSLDALEIIKQTKTNPDQPRISKE